jgi:hypothetical protein
VTLASIELAQRHVADVARAAGARAAVELAGLVRECVAADAVREVLHLHVAALGTSMRRPHHRRLLRETLDNALSSTRTRVFDLPNGDVVAVARSPAPVLDAAEAALRQSLDPEQEAAAVRRLRLPEEAAELLNAASEALGLDPGEPPPASLPMPGTPLRSAELAAAERALAGADLEPVTIVQSVCRLDPDGEGPEPIWEDRRVDWAALADLVLPGRDLAAAPALRKRLARAAEARLLAELSRPMAYLDWRPVGLPLSPATIEGPAFARFAQALPAGRAEEVTVGLRPADLLADPGAAGRVGPLLHRGGFRLALDDAAPGLVALLPPERLGLDVIRLRWSAQLPGSVPAPVARLLQAAADRVVLSGVDRPAAIAWGWEAGIRLFQGPLVERRRRGM